MMVKYLAKFRKVIRLKDRDILFGDYIITDGGNFYRLKMNAYNGTSIPVFPYGNGTKNPGQVRCIRGSELTLTCD